MKSLIFLPALILMLAAWGQAQAQSLNATSPRLLAAERAAHSAGDSFVTQGSTWTYPIPAIPTSKLPANAPERIVWFDAKMVELLFLGADPAIPYTAELTFLSDSADRALSVSVGRTVLDKRLKLPSGELVTRHYTIPSGTIQNGELRLTIKRLAGPNAVLASVKVFSSDPNAKALTPYRQPPLQIPTIRLSPRPSAVAGVSATSLSLNGTWSFNPAPPAEFWKDTIETRNTTAWKPIAVPGEWTMQGFTVTTGTAAGYRHSFSLPADWAGHRIKLRFDGVYAEAQVWVNGRLAGAHHGGFTPFELDITGLVKNGQSNDLALAVRSLGTKADGLASGSRYAEHDLGGIPRKVTLFAVPDAHLASLHVATTFDKQYRDATLSLDCTIANEGASAIKDATLNLSLRDPFGQEIAISPASLNIDTLAPGTSQTKSISIPVAAPRHWDSEHPNLYRLTCSLETGGKPLETLNQNVGFRQVEVRGNQLFVNGRAIKLRGVCRHETHPTLGRALNPELWEKDARMFRDGNVNYIRTSHYPPAEEFLDWCDRLGLFVESEAPLCWAPAAWVPPTPLDPQGVPEYIVRPTLEMVEFNRNHPSVIIWSMGNESQKWREYFAHSAAAVKAADPTRPRNFSGSNDQGQLEIAGPHYPGLKGPEQYAKAKRPTTFDEFIHLNCYNRQELVTDPGLRDFWGPGSDLMWNKMRASQGTLGGAIWAAIDDHFFLPDGRIVGYGPWGPLDGWRRPKPEYWHMKKIYSPLHIAERSLAVPAPGEPLRIPIENRFDYTDLREVRFVSESDGRRNEFTTAAAPQTTGEIVLRGGFHSGQLINLKAFSPLGYQIDEWNLMVGEVAHATEFTPRSAGKLKLDRYEGLIIISSPGFRLEIDGHTGIFRNSLAGEQEVLVAGPALMVLPKRPPTKSDTQYGGRADYDPFTATCTDWEPAEVTTGETADGVWIMSRGEYKEAKGSFTLNFRNDGLLTADYDFTLKQKVDARQIGIVFDIPRFCDTLSWRRDAYWSAYPTDHIGRPVGETRAFFENIPLTTQAGPSTQPAWPWSHDANSLGCNDFRSTKLNIREAMLRGDNGAGVRVVSDGKQHIRAWADDLAIRLLIADYANEGGASFFSEHVTPDRRLAPGDRIQGSARLYFLPPRK